MAFLWVCRALNLSPQGYHNRTIGQMVKWFCSPSPSDKTFEINIHLHGVVHAEIAQFSWETGKLSEVIRLDFISLFLFLTFPQHFEFHPGETVAVISSYFNYFYTGSLQAKQGASSIKSDVTSCGVSASLALKREGHHRNRNEVF